MDKWKKSETSPIAVSPKEAARLAGVGRTTLYRALSGGELQSSKIGKRRIILIDALKEWIANHKVVSGNRRLAPQTRNGGN